MNDVQDICTLVGVLGVDLLASDLLKGTAEAVGDLLRGVGVDAVAGLLGDEVEGLVAVVLGLLARGGLALLGTLSGLLVVIHCECLVCFGRED